MCGRFMVTVSRKLLAERFAVAGKLPALEPNVNIAPSQAAAAVVAGAQGGRRLELMRWGLTPSWPAAGRALLINARAESLAEKPAFQRLLERQRCLIPATGFYEWQKMPDGRRRPWCYALPDDAPFAFAGLWDTMHDADGRDFRAFTIVTTAANDLIRPVHDRMPVLLAPEAEAAWLDPAGQAPADLLPLLKPCPAHRLHSRDAASLLAQPGKPSVQTLLPF